MIHKAFGSVGASRVLRAAWHGTYGPAPGHRCWRLGDYNSDSSIDLEYSADRGKWSVYRPWADDNRKGWDVDRETARLLLRGLLAEEMVKELVEWMEVKAHNAEWRRSHDDGVTAGEIFRAVDVMDMLDKLCEIGATNE